MLYFYFIIIILIILSFGSRLFHIIGWRWRGEHGVWRQICMFSERYWTLRPLEVAANLWDDLDQQVKHWCKVSRGKVWILMCIALVTISQGSRPSICLQPLGFGRLFTVNSLTGFISDTCSQSASAHLACLYSAYTIFEQVKAGFPTNTLPIFLSFSFTFIQIPLELILYIW